MLDKPSDPGYNWGSLTKEIEMKWQNQWLEILRQQALAEARRIAAELASRGA